MLKIRIDFLSRNKKYCYNKNRETIIQEENILKKKFI